MVKSLGKSLNPSTRVSMIYFSVVIYTSSLHGNYFCMEYNKQYAVAISILNKVYDEHSYELNLRLGWLNYLNKDYPRSQLYYQKAVYLKPYAVEAKLGLVQPLAALQNVDKLLQVYDEILKIDPQNTKGQAATSASCTTSTPATWIAPSATPPGSSRCSRCWTATPR